MGRRSGRRRKKQVPRVARNDKNLFSVHFSAEDSLARLFLPTTSSTPRLPYTDLFSDYFLPKTSFRRAVVCAAGFLRIFFSSSPSS